MEFDECGLAAYQSYEQPDQPAPLNQTPPGREEHERCSRRIMRFSSAAMRHPRHFKAIIGRSSESEEV